MMFSSELGFWFQARACRKEKKETNSPAETQGNPDIGYIWVIIDFSDSLDLLDEKKSYLHLPNV